MDGALLTRAPDWVGELHLRREDGAWLLRVEASGDARFVRARFPEYSPEKAEQVLAELERTRGTHHGLRHEDLLRLPDKQFFRRKGEYAFQMVGVDGETFSDAEEYLRYLAKNLNEGYVASRDLRNYATALRGVAAGTMTVADTIMAMPKLKREGGTCPCSKGVRWVMEEPAGDAATPAEAVRKAH